MKIFIKPYFITLIFTTLFLLSYASKKGDTDPSGIVSYEVNPTKNSLKLYWKDDKGKTYESFGNLKTDLATKGDELVFAMNGGMYREDLSPQGLYIENGEVKAPLSAQLEGYGNFYLQPNGVFYLNKDNSAVISTTADFKANSDINFATQSGPMLVVDGAIHSKFAEKSTNLNIRNGVGILPNGNAIFAMSEEKINFYNFALYFKNLGCKNALYLDGYVSKIYLPAKNWNELGGSFGVIIGVTKPI